MQCQITERTIQSQCNEGNTSTVDSALKQHADSHRGRVNSKYIEVVMTTKMHMRNDGDKRDMQGMK